MNYNLSFKERAKLAMELLSKQSPVTLEEARKQALWLKEQSNSKVKKHITKLNMLHKYSLFLLSFLCFNCKNTENDIITYDSLESKTKELKEDETKPIFLGLSPKMKNDVFLEEIEKLNNNGKLENGNFILPLNNKNLEFKLQKTNNSIKLVCTHFKSKYREYLCYQESDKYLNEFNNKAQNLIDLFKKKYKSNPIKIPNDFKQPLYKYDLRKDNYLLFKDTVKSVLIGYSIIGYRVPSPSERKAEYEKLKSDNPDNPIIGIEINSIESSKFVDFGLEIEINYYYNDELELILQSINKEHEIFKKAALENEKRYLEKQNNKKNNLEEI
jgi:hypothetical protein